MKTLHTILIFIFFFVSLVGNAGVETYSSRIEGTDIAPSEIYKVYDAKHFDMETNPFWQNDYTNYKVRNFVRLGINPKVIQQANNSGSVELFITYETWNYTTGGFDIVTTTETLSVEYLTDGTQIIDDQSTFVFEDAHYINVEVISITGLDEEDLFLESIIEVERYYTMYDTQMVGLNDRPIPSGYNYSQAENEFIELYWPHHTGAESYELEWVHIHDYDFDTNWDLTSIAPSALAYDFYLNSTRIEVKENSYRVPNIFDRGYFLYRIRPIGRTGVDFTERVEGEWSAQTSGMIDPDHPVANGFLIDRQYDANMNWMHQIAYTENGKRFESVSYVDGLGRGRQTVARNTVTDQVVVSNVYYDDLGRPVISDLPTPVDGSYPRHSPDFNRADDVSEPSYNKEYFDMITGGGTCNLDSKGMHNDHGAAKYYSSENLNQDGANAYIPDAQHFPFSRITYRDDFTGRVDRIAGQGATLKMGEGHETRMMYVTPSQSELYQLFGVEAGIATHYQKTITVDPNNQVYVQYTDMAGRTVATYMTGESPVNLEALADASSDQMYEHILLGSGQGQDIAMTPPVATLTYTQYFAEESAEYTFEYSFNPQEFEDECMLTNTCFDCVYDFTISIVDECGVVVPIAEPTATINGAELDTICNGLALFELTPSLVLEIEKGLYTITKTLSVNQASIEEYWCMYINNMEPECLPTISTIFNDFYAEQEFPECNPDPFPPVLNDLNDCEVKRLLMINDLTPGGQYALYDVAGGVYSVSDPTSILYGTLWHGTYDDGNTYGSGDLEEFIVNFQGHWAEDFLLLGYHPEDCMLEFCDANAASYAYDQAMLDTYTFAEACSLGYILPLEFVPYEFDPSNGTPNFISFLDNACDETNMDPFFDTGGLGALYFGDMEDDLNIFLEADNTPNGYNDVNLWSLLMSGIMGGDNSTSAGVEAGFNLFMSYHNADRRCDLDLLWVRFRTEYLALKQHYYQLAQEEHAENECPAYVVEIGLGLGDYGNKVPIFPSLAYAQMILNQISAGVGAGTIDPTNQGQVTGLSNAMQAQACEDACTVYAQEWIQQLSGCNLDLYLTSGEIDDLTEAFVNMCMSGCDENHMGGASTPNPGNTTYVEPITGLTNPTIQEILDDFGISESFTCNEYLISEPAPYGIAEATIEQLMIPLDECGCEAIYQANYDLEEEVYPGLEHLEEVLFQNTGVQLEDAHYLLCLCDFTLAQNDPPVTWTPGFEWPSTTNASLATWNEDIPANLGCAEAQGCVDCDDVNLEVTALVTHFSSTDFEEFMTEPNAEIILRNYLNQELNFHLTYTDYLNFINGCNADVNNPYCTPNPIFTDWSKMMKLIAFRGQLIMGTALNLESNNIVYANSDLNDNGIGIFYTSSLNISGDELTTTFTYPSTEACDVTLTLLQDSPFGFEDIISINAIYPITSDCEDNTDAEAEVSYISCGIEKTGYILLSSECFEVNLCECGDDGQILCDDPYGGNSNYECYQPALDEMYQNAMETFVQNVNDQYQQFVEGYNSQCAAAFSTENFSYTGPDRYYQYTLFYYDQSGNLARTIAPEGIDLLANADYGLIYADYASVENSATYDVPTDGTTIPVHTYETSYEYNSYNQLVSTSNPDQEGATNFWYDFYGRIVASQNPVQADEDLYSYTFYDKQGRPYLVGQTEQTTPLTDAFTKVNDFGTTFEGWVNGGTRTEVTFTYYDKPVSSTIEDMFSNGQQENLRLRVASVFYYPSLSVDYESAIHYSYDIHGNVKEQIQDVPALAPVEQDQKRTQYSFELISGNVKKVDYQKGELDEMTHEYHYDKLNRLTEVFTSTDDVHKTREAHYRYYDYGPLARVELGQQKVQGMDYAYTINGWLKGMNSSMLDVDHDMGGDGIAGYLANHDQVHTLGAKDVVSYTLGYFNGDYTPIDGTTSMEASMTVTTDPFETYNLGLYNGNIRHVVTSIEGMTTLGAAYKYDQLQRLKEMTAFYNTNTDNSWTDMAASTEYFSSYSYDRNGNITSLHRKGVSGAVFDNLDYNYIGLDNVLNASSVSKSNRLAYVLDNAAADGTVSDITDQTPDLDPYPYNYEYDDLGQLLRDKQEDLEMEWRYGDKKLKSITKSSEVITFIYNPFGQRVMKTVTPTSGDAVHTYYAYDANGQVMAVYDIDINAEADNYMAMLSEQHIYGASRLGMRRANMLIYDNGTPIVPPTEIFQYTIGLRAYEVTNYLGNVNAIVTDRKTWNFTDNLYEAEVIMKADYYPGGMQMPGRHISSTAYRYGYNGMEMDNEVSGIGNSYTTEFRQYDPRLMRWKSLDPLMHEFPDMSPYCAFDNNPIYYTDPYGLASTNGDKDGERAAKRAERKAERKAERVERWSNGGKRQQIEEMKVTAKRAPQDDTNSNRRSAGEAIEEEIKDISPRDVLVLPRKVAEPLSGWSRLGYHFGMSQRTYITESGYEYKVDMNGNLQFPQVTGTPPDISKSIGKITVQTVVKSLAKPKTVISSLKKTLPSWKTIKIDIKHITSGHMKGGSRVSPNSAKSTFPESMNADDIEKAVREAYRNVFKKVQTQGDRIKLQGKTKEGLEIEMWVNKATKTIETAYPK